MAQSNMALGTDTKQNKSKRLIKDIENFPGGYVFPESTKSTVTLLPFWALPYFGNKNFSYIRRVCFHFCKYIFYLPLW